LKARQSKNLCKTSIPSGCVVVSRWVRHGEPGSGTAREEEEYYFQFLVVPSLHLISSFDRDTKGAGTATGRTTMLSAQQQQQQQQQVPRSGSPKSKIPRASTNAILVFDFFCHNLILVGAMQSSEVVWLHSQASVTVQGGQ
jgi:hypothetical protein